MPCPCDPVKLNEVTVGLERLTRRHVIVLAHFFGVSRSDCEAIGRLKLAKSGTWDCFQPSAASHFENLVIGRGDATLDDGEAATIAYGF
jgi:hypothetical protein